MTMRELITIERSRLLQWALALLIGGAPVWMVLVVWDFASQREAWQIFVRSNSFAIPLIEFIVTLIAMSTGFSPLLAIGKLPRLTKIALLFWLLIVVSTSFQQDNDYLGAAIGSMKLFFAALFFLALVELRRTGNEKLFNVIWVNVGVGIVIYFLLWMLFIGITSPTGEEWVIQVPGVNNVRHIGHFAFAGFCAAIVCLMLFQNHADILWRWVFPIFLATLCLGMALWTGSRGPTLAMLLSMSVVVALGSGFRRQLCSFFVTAALLSTSIVALLPVPHPIYGLFGATGIVDLEAGASHDASSGRTKIWIETIDKIQEKPLFGWGLEQFSASGPNDTIGMRHPHNFPLQLLFSGGIVCSLLAALIAFSSLRNWQWPYRNGIGLAGTGCVAGLVFYSMYDGTLFFSYPIMLFLLAIATSINPSEQQYALDK